MWHSLVCSLPSGAGRDDMDESSLHSSPLSWSHYHMHHSRDGDRGRPGNPPVLTPSATSAATSDEGRSSSGVREWYAGQTVLVTGVTGLLGKVVLHKLLSLLPDPPPASPEEERQWRRVLVLVRPKAASKRGEGPISGSSRFAREVLSSPPLHHLLTARPTLARYLHVRLFLLFQGPHFCSRDLLAI